MPSTSLQVGEHDSEAAPGAPAFAKYRAESAAQPIEEVGRRLRPMMSWIGRA